MCKRFRGNFELTTYNFAKLYVKLILYLINIIKTVLMISLPLQTLLEFLLK